MMREWENPGLQHRNRLPGRMSQADPKLRILLDGEWDFCLAANPYEVPEGFEKPEEPSEGNWGKIRVPGCWQMQGYGASAVYSASPYLFVTDPPFVAEDNEIGLYRTKFSVPENFSGMKLILRFEGANAMIVPYLNGHEIGMSKGAHMMAEFDVTDAAVPGQNLLAVKVYRFSDASYLEIQDMIHMSGIFRSVSLLAMPVNGIYDAVVHADMEGNLTSDVSLLGENTVTQELFDEEGKSVGRAEGAVISMHVDAPRLWTAETPCLYTLKISVPGQCVEIPVGFRSIGIKNGQLLINGRAIKAKGMNHHDTNTFTGWAVPEEAMLQDVLLMKRHNINFVRTSHYPSPAYFYDLADRYGLYILSEADIECHGMGITEINALSSDPAWAYAYTDRGTRMVKEHKNHPSVIIWSMGNESGFGENFRILSKAIKALDGRPVHYSQAKDTPSYIPEEIHRDPEKMYQMVEKIQKTPWDPCVDIESSMYMAPSELEKNGQREEARPFLLCEYAHSMGNGPGGLREYWEVIRKYPRLLGACVWEWQDHGLIREKNGKKYVECGDGLNMPYKRDGINGNFCNDGLLSPEKIPHPGLYELKKVLQPYRAELIHDDPVVLKITNLHTFLTGSETCSWRLLENGRELKSGAVDISALAPGESMEAELPVSRASGEQLLNLSFSLKEDAVYAPAGFETAAEQFVLGRFRAPAPAASAASLRVKRDRMSLTVSGNGFSYGFDLLHGEMTSLVFHERELLRAPLKQHFFRAPTDNDIGIVGPDRPGAANKWKDNGLDRLNARNRTEPEIKEEDGRVQIILHQRFGANPYPPVLDTDTVFTVLAGGAIEVSVAYTALQTPYIKADFYWPRLGFTLQLDPAFDRIRWYGRGPEENYSDRCSAQKIGWYEKQVTDLHTAYSRMQENGARTDNRFMKASDKNGRGIRFTALHAPFTFTAHDYTDEALTEAWHEYELSRVDAVVVNIDLKQGGLGTNSCGPEPFERYRVRPEKDSAFSFRITPEPGEMS